MDHHQHVMYGFTYTITFEANVGPTPVPTVTLPAIGLLDVTNGYVPWSISNITPCAPSKSTFSSAAKMHRLRFWCVCYKFF